MRGGWSRRRTGCRRNGPRPAHRPAISPGGHRVRGIVLPEGRLRSEAAGRQLRLPLSAPDVRDRGQRAAETADRREAAKATGKPSRSNRRAARARVQAGHQRHSRGVEPRPGIAPDRRGCLRQGLGSRHDRGCTTAPSRCRALRGPPRGGLRGGCRSRRHGVERAAVIATGRGALRHADPLDRRRTQFPRSGDRAAGRLRVRGDRATTAAVELQPAPEPVELDTALAPSVAAARAR